MGMIPVPYVEKLAGLAQGKPGNRNSNSYGVPEPAHAYAQPRRPRRPRRPPAPGAAGQPLPSTQNGPVFAKAPETRALLATRPPLALEVRLPGWAFWGFDTWVFSGVWPWPWGMLAPPLGMEPRPSAYLQPESGPPGSFLSFVCNLVSVRPGLLI